MTRRAVLAGASGFIGPSLENALRDDGYTVARIGRTGPGATWRDPDAVRRLVDGAELVVNLAGKSVNCRYTDANRDEILRSRVATTRALAAAIAAADSPPPVWLNASTATIYRYALDHPQTEAHGELGTGFSVDVARTWEEEFYARDLPGTRRAALRMAIVLGDGPATALLLRLARWGLGGQQIDGPWFAHRRYRGIGPHPTGVARGAHAHRSHGRQRFSWIHVDDVVEAVRFVRDRADIAGPVNLVAPGASDNATLMRELRRAVGMPFGLPAHRFMLEPAMFALRTEPELVLKSRWVAPEVLTAAGYTFRYAELRAAIDAVVGRRRGVSGFRGRVVRGGRG